MNEANSGALILMPAASCATNATQGISFSKLTTGVEPFDHANIYVLMGTHATNGSRLGTLKLSESDTATSPTSMTDIVAFTGGTATSSTIGFVIPTAASVGPGAVIEFQVDLRKRKKYVGLQITPGTTTIQIAVLARLSRAKESADTATQKSAVLNNVLGTSVSQCAKVVAG